MACARLAMAAAVVGLWLPGALAQATASAPAARIPVILETDIGDDIDDTWALVMLLKSPQFDLKLVTTTCGKSEYRAKLIARLLTVAGRTDVPVGLGAGGAKGSGKQQPWVQEYKLSDYAGKVYQDGVTAMIDTIMASAEPITVIELGPAHTLAAALDKNPAIAAKANLVGMLGSLRKGSRGEPKPVAEYNVQTNVAAAKKVLAAPWRSVAITPLDTCGLVDLPEAQFPSLRDSASKDPLVEALLENYRIWSGKKSLAELKRSSILFDTAAIYLADPAGRALMELESLNVAVTAAGMTVVDPAGAKMTVATGWKDLEGYRNYLLKALGPTPATRAQ
jgi:inosine-uridine nucleoside N-ribohydrolase